MRIGIKLIIGCLIAFAITHFEAHAQTGTGKQAFYSAIASGSTTAWNKQLEAVNTMSGNDKKAFQGALLMRKSGVQKRLDKSCLCLNRATNCWRQLSARKPKTPNTDFYG